MGKSDPFVFSWYIKNLPDIEPKKIAILGSTTDNFVRFKYPNSEIHLFDIQLGNWSINEEWEIKKEFYDLVVCTRCAYFAKEPNIFISKCLSLLKIDGYLFVDWGLGDHWRYKNYKVGWIRDGEHEKAYFNDNFLHSCFWNEELESDLVVKSFWNAVKLNNFNYTEDLNLSDVINKEVPKVINYDCVKIETFFLWPESPQLYIATILKKGD